MVVLDVRIAEFSSPAQKLQKGTIFNLCMSNSLFAGVPYFFMNDKPTFSGAQDINAFLATFERV
jgi:hypothetical protein